MQSCGKKRRIMKQVLKEAGYCMVQAVRHPLTPIFLINPGGTISPIPWWGSGAILIVGITSWVISARCGIVGLDEAARAMVYIPLGNIFGMTVKLRNH